MSVTNLKIPEKLNIAVEFIDKNIKLGRGKNVAIYYEDQVLTYDDVYKLVNKTGNALLNLGIGMEDRVLLFMFDCPEFVASFFGAAKIGAVPIPANTMFKSKDYLYLLNDSRAKVAIVSEELVPEIEEIRSELLYLRHLVVVGKAGINQLSFEELLTNASDELIPADTSKDDVAFWIYSSGSTGNPKGTVHLQHDMLCTSELYAKGVLGINEKDITYSVSKLFFAYGLGNGMYFALRFGAATVLLPGRSDPQSIFEVINRFKPTLFFGVPTSYGSLLHKADQFQNIDMSSIRYCVSAGEALPSSIFKEWKEKFNLTILDGIGSTECLHVFISNQPGKVNPGSTGIPVPGYEAKIVDPDGNIQPPNEIGTLMVKGDSIAAYYWNKHEKSKASFQGEWLNTGDKYYIDEDGYFWYAGRGDDMIKAGGIWVSPIEVENTIIEHPAVLECGVIGAVDKDSLEKPLAYVVLKEGFESSEEIIKEIQQYVKSRIAAYKYPRWVRIVDELPKTATGKIMRYVLRDIKTSE